MTNKIEEAKAILKQAGYYTDNLWHVDDVKSRFECDDSQAQKVLNSALTNEATMAQIWEAIHCAAEFDELPYIDDAE
jgi:hypothetical protein